jgi:hypothetical protein
MAYESLGRANRNYGRHLVRLNIGLEEPKTSLPTRPGFAR